MSRILMLDECGIPEIVGHLGVALRTAKRARLRVVDGFIVPIGEELELGLSNEILRAFDALNTKTAVLRSSYQDENVFAGETLRDISRDALIPTISYLQQNAIRHGQEVAVVVQASLRAEFSGTIHSYNPATLDHNEILIEANIWMNETVLSGEAEADMILINKSTGAVTTESDEEGEICLTPKQISYLHNLIRKVENTFKQPVSVDWCFDNGLLYVLNVRPINGVTYERYQYE